MRQFNTLKSSQVETFQYTQFLKSWFISFVLLVCMGVNVVHAHDDDNGAVGAVFAATNDATLNGIMMYLRAKDGTLTVVPGSPFSTQGQGTGPGAFLVQDPLASKGSLVVDEDNKFLFAANAGSNEISVFRIHRSGLTLVDKVSSGGAFPNSLTVHDNILYVLNSAGYTNFVGFKVDKDGHLKPLTNGKCDLLGPLNQFPLLAPSGQPMSTSIPGQIGYTPDGKQLVIIRKEGLTTPNPFGVLAGPGRIDVYKLDNRGLPDCQKPTANINQRIPAGQFPFSFIFSEEGYLLVDEIFGSASYANSPFNASGLTSYNLKPNGQLKVITSSLPSGETAVCWIARSGSFVYTTNFFSDSISLYKVDKKGSLTLITGQAALVGPAPHPSVFPIDMDISSDGRFLYQLVPGSALIHAFKINKQTGGLTSIGTVNIGMPSSGQAGIAISDFNNHKDW